MSEVSAAVDSMVVLAAVQPAGGMKLASKVDIDAAHAGGASVADVVAEAAAAAAADVGVVGVAVVAAAVVAVDGPTAAGVVLIAVLIENLYVGDPAADGSTYRGPDSIHPTPAR